MGVEREDEHSATREEAQRLFEMVCRKIDALSNFSFAPRPFVPDLKVTPAVPAISMEEVLPMGVATDEARAPEEIYAKKRGRDGLVRSQEEVGQDDRKRMRRSKKAARRKARQAALAEAKLASRINPGLGNPYEKRKLVESLRSSRNVLTGSQVNMEEGRKSHTSSAKFFETLEDERSRAQQGR